MSRYGGREERASPAMFGVDGLHHQTAHPKAVARQHLVDNSPLDDPSQAGRDDDLRLAREGPERR